MCQTNAINRDLTNAIGLALAVGRQVEALTLQHEAGADVAGGWFAEASHDTQIDLIDAAAKVLDQVSTPAGFWERHDWELSLRALAVDLVEHPREPLDRARVLTVCVTYADGRALGREPQP